MGACAKGLESVAKEHGITYPRSVRWRPLDPNLFTAFSRPAVFAGSTVAVHVLSAKPLTGAGAKQYVAKELGVWEGAGGYYDGNSGGGGGGGGGAAARYLSVAGVIGQVHRSYRHYIL